MPLPFEYLGTIVTEDNYLEVLKEYCKKTPTLCHTRLISFAFGIADISPSSKFGQYRVMEDWLNAHCIRKFGTNWDTDHSEFEVNAYNMLKYYIDRLERLDIMVSREFGNPLFFNYATL